MCGCVCTYLHDCSIRGGTKSLILHVTFLHTNAHCLTCFIRVMTPKVDMLKLKKGGIACLSTSVLNTSHNHTILNVGIPRVHP